MTKYRSDALRIKIAKQMVKEGYSIEPDGRFTHRVVYEKVYGKIPKTWHVHHIDENKFNNDINNLIAIPKKLHEAVHRVMRAKKIQLTKKNIEDMLKSYIRLDRNRGLSIKINITLSYSQIKETESMPVSAEETPVYRTGSSLYR